MKKRFTAIILIINILALLTVLSCSNNTDERSSSADNSLIDKSPKKWLVMMYLAGDCSCFL